VFDDLRDAAGPCRGNRLSEDKGVEEDRAHALFTGAEHDNVRRGKQSIGDGAIAGKVHCRR
jgi:hypothetical protein